MLLLRPTIINGNRYDDDYAVIWRSRQFGRHVVGRIRRATERSWQEAPDWIWSLTTGIGNGVSYGYGAAKSLDQAKQKFRAAFERKELETPTRRWARGYECEAAYRFRIQRMSWKARFDDPVPLPEGGAIKTLSEARAYMLSLSEREQMEQRWQDAAKFVLKAIEERPWIFFARLALYKAIHRTDDAIPPAPDVKKADTWRERRRARKAAGK